MDLVIVGGCLAILFLVGTWEKKRHRGRLDSIALRINVNGIRGKSTATRLITALLSNTGTKTLGKTTGTSARLLLPNATEIPIRRPARGPNIGEQKRVVARAVQEKVDALVCECMAVTPDYQVTFQEEYLQAQIGIIVNVLEDHMDVMGPTLDQVAEAFHATIPWNGTLVTVDNPYLADFRTIAAERGSDVVVALPEEVTEEMLSAFPYIVFRENVAIALAVARVLGINRQEAFAALLRASPDPGATRLYHYEAEGREAIFVNGFAANDAHSTVKMFERTFGNNASKLKPLYIMNCRADRVGRTEQFAQSVLPALPRGVLIAVGDVVRPISEAVSSGTVETDEYLALEGSDVETIIYTVNKLVSNHFIFGLGNIHGVGAGLVQHFAGKDWEE